MRTLIVDDDFTSRKLIQSILLPFGECDIASNGNEAVEAFQSGLEEKKPYDLICMDIMMPETDGTEALIRIRDIEKKIGIRGDGEVKVIMTSALDDPKAVFKSFYKGGATSYIVKPLGKQQLLDEVRKLGLLK